MKRILSLFLALIAFACVPSDLMASDWYMQIRGSYFYPASRQVRDTYSRVWLDYEFETSTEIYDHWHFWANANWSSKRGNRDLSGFDERTRIWILPISAGVKYQLPLTYCASLYLGAGVCYTFLRVENEYSYFDERHGTSKGSLGAVGKSGIIWILSDYTFLDVFADYYNHRFNLSTHHSTNDYFKSHHRVDFSGFKFGLGFGVYF